MSNGYLTGCCSYSELLRDEVYRGGLEAGYHGLSDAYPHLGDGDARGIRYDGKAAVQRDPDVESQIGNLLDCARQVVSGAAVSGLLRLQ